MLIGFESTFVVVLPVPIPPYPTALYSCACSTMLCIEPIAASTPATPYTAINVMLNQSSTPLGFLACTGVDQIFLASTVPSSPCRFKSRVSLLPIGYSPFKSAGSQLGCVCVSESIGT